MLRKYTWQNWWWWWCSGMERVGRETWLWDLLESLQCPWKPLRLFSELCNRTVLFFFLDPALYDLRDLGVRERPSEGMLGTLRPIMGAQRICWCCYFSLVPRVRSSAREHLCTMDVRGQRPSGHLWAASRRFARGAATLLWFESQASEPPTASSSVTALSFLVAAEWGLKISLPLL